MLRVRRLSGLLHLTLKSENAKNNKREEAFAYKRINNLSIILEMFWIDDPRSASTFVPVTAAPGFEALESSLAWPIAPFSRHL